MSEAAWQEMVDAEELILTLGPRIRTLERSFEDLRLPDAASRELFDAVVSIVDLDSSVGAAPGASLATGTRILERELRTAPPGAPSSPHGLHLLTALFRSLDSVDWVHLAVLRGRFRPDRRGFDTTLELSGRARTREDRITSLSGAIEVGWRRLPNADPTQADSWRIDSWRAGPLELQETERPLFREVLGAVLPDPATLERARHSEHEALVLRYLRDPRSFVPPTPYFHLPAHDRHPGLAVADVDGNGWDDLYVMPRWGPNQLFLNQGNGRFEERAKIFGLDLEAHSSAAIFADFDNDGDRDLFLGRTLVPSLYLENRGGHFVVKHDALAAGALPALVASLSAIDVDDDGLLDVYVSTYAADLLVRELQGRTAAAQIAGRTPGRVLSEFLPEADAAALYRRAHDPSAHEYLALPGPPNLMLRNRGHGRFELPPPEDPLRIFANTYQATWSDFDGDGDPDVYLAHDFSPNQLLRNDGGGRFTDVTGSTGTADIGFGMGVSFGDYDRDGREDLYVTNMYSRAGRRITESLDGLEPSFARMARGNTLFRNAGDHFERVSGDRKGKIPVEIAGWSWGGQFTDLDNDGFLDLYALSGYYTAPPAAEALVDT